MASTSNDRVIRPDNGQRNELANALRALAMDAVQQANSGHPGAVATILATGSEVAMAMAAQQLLGERGMPVRVVSIPSTTVFDRQHAAWRKQDLGRGLPRIGVEAGVSRWWTQYGCVAALGIDSFGESAPAARLYEHFGFDAQRLADLVALHVAAEGVAEDGASRQARSSN